MHTQDVDLAFTDAQAESGFCTWRSARLAARDAVHCVLLLLLGATLLLWQWRTGLSAWGGLACSAGGMGAPSFLSNKRSYSGDCVQALHRTESVCYFCSVSDTILGRQKICLRGIGGSRVGDWALLL